MLLVFVSQTHSSSASSSVDASTIDTEIRRSARVHSNVQRRIVDADSLFIAGAGRESSRHRRESLCR